MNLPSAIFCQHLKRQLETRLPGSTSHLKMLPPGRVLEFPSEQNSFLESAVLIVLFPFREQIGTCLIRRPASMKNHAGQIAFPGGKREKEDLSLIRTALREAREEIGIDPDSVEILGELSTVYVQVSKFLIKPVLGWLQQMPELVADLAEVDEVICISLEDLANQANRCDREMETMTGKLSVPGYEINGLFIWGATAMILAELADIYQEISQL